MSAWDHPQFQRCLNASIFVSVMLALVHGLSTGLISFGLILVSLLFVNRYTNSEE